MSNILFDFNGLPPFSAITPELVKPAVEQALSACRQAVEAAAMTRPVTWQSLIVQSEEVSDHLGRLWSPVSHLNSVLSSPELRSGAIGCSICITWWVSCSFEFGQRHDNGVPIATRSPHTAHFHQTCGSASIDIACYFVAATRALNSVIMASHVGT